MHHTHAQSKVVESMSHRVKYAGSHTFVTSNTEVSETLPLCKNLLIPIRLSIEPSVSITARGLNEMSYHALEVLAGLFI